MSTSYHGKRWKPIQAGKGRTKVRAPQSWEMASLFLLLGLIVGFVSGITWNLATPKSRIVVVEKPVPMHVGEGEAGKQEPKDRQRVAAALQRYRESGASEEELAVLYTQFKDRGWDVPEEIERAFEKKISNVNKPVK